MAAVAALMAVQAVAYAAPDASSILSTTESQLRDMASLIVNVVSVLMGIIGAVMLAVNLAKYAKGDPSSNDSLMKVGGGLLIATVLLQIIRVIFL